MDEQPHTCLVDTNVPKTANLSNNPHDIPDELFDCVQRCVEAVEHVCQKKGLVLDAEDEIFDEYRRQLSMSGQPGVGDRFMKWVHDHRWSLPEQNRVTITKDGDGYEQFPKHSGLQKFDKSDQKFVAVANAHPDKPPILEATDSKWWGWNGALTEVGITVQFLCPKFIENKFLEKMKTGTATNPVQASIITTVTQQSVGGSPNIFRFSSTPTGDRDGPRTPAIVKKDRNNGSNQERHIKILAQCGFRGLFRLGLPRIACNSLKLYDFSMWSRYEQASRKKYAKTMGSSVSGQTSPRNPNRAKILTE